MISVVFLVALGAVGLACALPLEVAALHRRDQRLIGVGWGIWIASLAVLVLAGVAWAGP